MMFVLNCVYTQFKVSVLLICALKVLKLYEKHQFNRTYAYIFFLEYCFLNSFLSVLYTQKVLTQKVFNK